jgi:hypothetical protein
MNSRVKKYIMFGVIFLVISPIGFLLDALWIQVAGQTDIIKTTEPEIMKDTIYIKCECKCDSIVQ